MASQTKGKVLLGFAATTLAATTGLAAWVLWKSGDHSLKNYDKSVELAKRLNELVIDRTEDERAQFKKLLKSKPSYENLKKIQDEIKKLADKERKEHKRIFEKINEILDESVRNDLHKRLKDSTTHVQREQIEKDADLQIAKEWEDRLAKKRDYVQSIIADIKDEAKKQELLEKLAKQTKHSLESLQEMDKIAIEAKKQVAKETGDEIDQIAADMLALEYPGGVTAPAVLAIQNKLNKIKDSDFSNAKKLEEAQKIKDTFDAHNEKIKEVKEAIKKLDASKHKQFNSLLDNANYLYDNEEKVLEFDDILKKIQEEQIRQYDDFKAQIEALKNLTDAEKETFKNSLNETSSVEDIKNKLKEAYKKDLENFIKNMDYPGKPDSQAQNNLISGLTDDKYVDEIAYKNELDRLKELNKLVDTAKENLKSIKGDKTELNNKFNEANDEAKLKALLVAIEDERLKEERAAKRAELDSYIDSLPYPDGSTKAKDDLKKLYEADSLEMSDLVEKEKYFKETIDPKVREAKNKIAKLSTEDQEKLNAEFKNAGSEEKLDALLAKINEAFNNSKEAQKSVIDELTHLSLEQKEALKNQIDKATDFADVKKIVDRAQLLDKIEEAKSIITPESYALDENPEVKAIIDETIKSLKNQIEGLTDDQVATKKAELDELNKKLKEYKNQIEALTDNEVNNPTETKVDLAKELAKISNKDQFPNLDLEIAKAKLKKVASDLDYPGKPNNAAIKELQAQIEAVTTQEQLNQLDDRIKNVLPNKIAQAKAKIAEVRDSETTTRKQDLNRQLDEADTDEEFDALFKNIEKYKAQGDEEYSNKLKERLKEQAARLPYPSTNAAAKTALERRIEAETDIAELEKLQNETIPSMLNKINELKEEIAKRSPENITKLNEKLNNASTPEELAAIDAEITKAINDEKAAIAAKIDALAHLTPEQKDAAKAKLDNKTYSEMEDVLERAKRDNLLGLVNKLGYNDSETLPAPARTSLRGAVETTPKNELDSKLTELEALKTAIENEKTEIDQINYSSDDAEGKNDLNERLNNLTTSADVSSLVNPSEINNKLSVYKEIINDVNNPLSPTQKSDLISDLDKLPKNGAESALRKEIFKEKRNAVKTKINGLSNLSDERKQQLISELASFEEQDKTSSFEDFKNKVDQLSAKLLEAQKEDLIAKIAKIPFTNKRNNNDVAAGENTEGENVSPNASSALEGLVNSINSPQTYKTQKEYIEQYEKNLIAKQIEINEIKDQNEKAALLAAADKIQDKDSFNSLDTPIAKALDKDFIDTLSNLTQDEKNEFKDKLAKQDDETLRENIKQQAQNKNDLKGKKNELNAIIDAIPYPKQDMTAYNRSIKHLKDAVEALDENANFENEKNKLNGLKTAVDNAVKALPNIPYNDEGSTDEVPALNTIKAKIDSLTETADVTSLLGDDWNTKVAKLKKVIKDNFDGADETALLTQLKNTVPNSFTDSNNKELDLNTAILDKVKENAKAKVADMQYLSDKTVHNSNITNVALTEENNDIQANGIDEVNNKLLDAYKANFTSLIDSFAYPKDGENASSWTNDTRSFFITNNIDNLTSKSNFTNLDIELTNIKNAASALSKEILGDTETNIRGVQNEVARNEFNKQFLAARTVQDLNTLKEKVVNYKKLEAKILAMTDFANEGGDERESNGALAELRNELTKKLANATTVQAQNDLSPLIDENKKLVDKLRRTFQGDILAAKNFLTSAKDKSTVADVTNVINTVQPFKNELAKFWTTNKGNILRSKSWGNNWPSNPPKFVSYNELVREIRTKESAAALKKAVDVDVERYKEMISLNEYSKESHSSNIPENVKQSLLYKALQTPYNLNLPTNATNEQIKNAEIKQIRDIKKYFGNQSADAGIYKSAKAAYDSIVEPNKSLFTEEFNNIATSNNDLDVTIKIDAFKLKATEFNQAYPGTQNSLNTFKTTYGATQEEIQTFERELNSASNKTTLDELKSRIDSAIQEKNAKKARDLQIARDAIGQLPQGNTKKTELTNSINNAESNNQLSESLLTNATSQAQTEKANIDNAKNAANTAVNSLPEGNNLKRSLKNKLLNAPNTNETNEVSKLDELARQARTEKQNLEAKRIEAQNILDGLTEKEDYQNEINSARNIDELDEIIRRMQTPKILDKSEAQRWANYISATATSSTVSRAQYLQSIERATTQSQLEQIIGQIRSYLESFPRNVTSGTLSGISTTHRHTYARLKAEFDRTWDEDRLNEIREQARNAVYQPPEF
ncbi:coiled-coil domain-containing protein [Mycoplasmopsis edwardii]|nr:GA module-containing protein [Mycoplasmopsis edwardii]